MRSPDRQALDHIDTLLCEIDDLVLSMTAFAYENDPSGVEREASRLRERCAVLSAMNERLNGATVN